MAEPGHGPSVHLCHPFTARAVGWADEAALPEFHSGPHATALRHLAATIDARCTVSYFTDARRPRSEVVDGLRYRFWPRSIRFRSGFEGFRSEWSIAELAHEAVAPGDVTIINTSGHGGRFSQAHGRLLQARRRPYVAMLGGLHASTSGKQRRFLEGASVVAVHNTSLRDRLLGAGLDASRVVVVPLGVDTEQFSPVNLEGAPTILFVGRLVDFKGVERLIDAMTTIASVVPEAILRLVGPVPDPEYGRSLRDLAARRGVSDRVAFVGPRPRGELVEEYRRASVMVLPSEGEGFGMVVAESMACGTPVVALDVPGGPRDMITDDHDGLLVPPAALGSSIASLIEDASRLERFRQAARSTAEDRLSSATTNECFVEFVRVSLGHR